MHRILVAVLLLILTVSGLAVIYAKHNSRLVFIDIQKKYKLRNLSQYDCVFIVTIH